MGELLAFLKSETTWAIVSAVSGMVAALAAMFTVYQAVTAARADREAKRPYFTIEAPGIKPLPISPPYRIQITMQNVGAHPATTLEGKILFVDAALAAKPAYTFDFSVANDVPSGSPTPWYNDSVMLPNNVPPMYVILAVSYRDDIIGRSYSQAFYMKWAASRTARHIPTSFTCRPRKRSASKRQCEARLPTYVRGELVGSDAGSSYRMRGRLTGACSRRRRCDLARRG